MNRPASLAEFWPIWQGISCAFAERRIGIHDPPIRAVDSLPSVCPGIGAISTSQAGANSHRANRLRSYQSGNLSASTPRHSTPGRSPYFAAPEPTRCRISRLAVWRFVAQRVRWSTAGGRQPGQPHTGHVRHVLQYLQGLTARETMRRAGVWRRAGDVAPSRMAWSGALIFSDPHFILAWSKVV